MDTLATHQPPARGAKLTMPPVILAPIDLGSETPLAPAGAGPSRPGPDRTILSARYDHCIVDLHPFLLAEAGTVTPQQRAKTDRLEPDEAWAHDEPPRGTPSEFP
jgi:hypothetical protein